MQSCSHAHKRGKGNSAKQAEEIIELLGWQSHLKLPLFSLKIKGRVVDRMYNTCSNCGHMVIVKDGKWQHTEKHDNGKCGCVNPGEKGYEMLELNRIYNIDCLEGLKQLEDKSTDLVLTDPPYNANFDYGQGYDDNKPWEEYTEWIVKVIKECERVCKGPVLFFVSKKGLIYLNQVYMPKWVCAWIHGPGNPPGNIHGTFFMPYWEPCLVYGNLDSFQACMDDTWKIHTERDIEHPCPKPIKLFRQIISYGSWQVILDPFIGSGTSAVAAKNLGRSFIGFEINKEYCDLANRRLAQRQLERLDDF